MGFKGCRRLLGGGLKRGEVGFKGTEGYRGVRCGSDISFKGTVWEWNSSDESAIKCKRFKRKLSPPCKRFFRPYN